MVNWDLNDKLHLNISLNDSNVFDDNDRKLIENNVFFDNNNNIDDLINYGKTEINPSSSSYGMWLDNKRIHIFDKIYKKLLCCTNTNSIDIPLFKKNQETGQMEVIKKTIHRTNNMNCNVNGVDYYDDNTKPENANNNCESLIQSYLSYLSKYNPEHEHLKTIGGCYSEKNIRSFRSTRKKMV